MPRHSPAGRKDSYMRNRFGSRQSLCGTSHEAWLHFGRAKRGPDPSGLHDLASYEASNVEETYAT